MEKARNPGLSCDRRPTTDDRRPTTDDRRPTTDDRRPTTDDRRPTTDDQRPTTDDRRPTTDDRPPTTDESVHPLSASICVHRCASVVPIVSISQRPKRFQASGRQDEMRQRPKDAVGMA
jgi:hypothetical protein